MKKTGKKRLVLFDAHALIHRAYHALPDMSTKQGEPTGGLYGLLTMLIRAIGDYRPDYIAACYDLPGKTFRHVEYADYKGTRVKADDELKAQLQRSRDVFAALHIPIYDAPGFEGDDMLGTIVEQTKDIKDLEVVIVTGDADSLQLVDGERVRVFTLRKGLSDVVVYDAAAVKERYGFVPALLPDYKGFCGDTSDNIPGVDGIGEKTASDIVSRFGSVEDIYARLEKDEEGMLKEGLKPRTIKLLKEGADNAVFSKMLATIRRDAPIKYELPKDTWIDAFTVDKALALFQELEFRTLGARLKALAAEVKGVPVEKEAIVIPAPFDDEPHDAVLLRKAQIAYWLIDSEKGGATKETICSYTNTTSLIAAMEKLEIELKKLDLKKLYEEIELPLIPIIQELESRGIMLDKDHLAKLSKEYHTKIERIRKTIYTLSGEEFNINSPKQLGVVLFEKLGISEKGIRKTAGGGARSTKESELEKMKDAHPVIEKILEYREIQKVLTTYIDALPPLADEQNRVHTKLHQDGTVTGRFSSTDPNLQNIPVRDGYGELIRDAFIAPRGKLLLAFDYSQIELRVLAMLSGDKHLRDIFESGADIHAAVASRVFNVPEDKVSDMQRRRAKTINFGILYGMGVSALATSLGVPRSEAQEFHDQYFAAFPTIRAYLENVLKEATKLGYTTTMFGRRRPFQNLKSKIPFVKAMAERMAMNAPLQGTAADLVKKAMIAVDTAIKAAGLEKEIQLLLQVHDELIFEVVDKPEVVKRAKEIIKEAMEGVHRNTPGASIPLLVTCASGQRWGSLTKK
ncbi:MAG TPA: DNA polymerase [Candidatus Paceibacterota bacterium]|nr:DNA polymerase [Candidatus Paceibacterota bacterium]